MEKLIKLIQRLEAVAKKNDDEFEYNISIKPRFRTNRLQFIFEVREKPDNHVILSGNGFSLDAAIDMAEADLPSSMREFGYEI